MTKKFKLQAHEIKEIATGYGRCFATDMITVGGKRVGYMYREEPRDSADSGWCFMSGKESQKYMDDPDNLEIYDVNTISNYDQEIIPFLDAPYHSAFERNHEGKFIEVEE